MVPDTVLEAVMLYVKVGMEAEFEAAMRTAAPLIASSQGYLSHELQRCMELPHKYLLLVRWESLESHTVGFRGSPAYGEWRALLHHFYDPFPLVEHFVQVDLRPAPAQAAL